MKRTLHKLAIFLAISLACQYVSASHLVKRADDEDKSLLDSLKDMLGGMPVIGSTLAGMIETLQNMWSELQELTNGAVGRLLGGAFPCKIAIDKITCSGVTAQSSLSDVVRDLLDPLPSLMLPGIAKKFIYMGVDGLGVPLVDLLLGGVPKKQKKS